MILMIQPIIMATLSPLAGRLSDRIEPRLLASAGMVITCVGLGLLSQLDADSSVQYIVMSLVMTGTGFSLFSSPNINAIMGSVDNKHAGGASGAVATTRLMGQLNSMVLVTLAIALIMGNTPVSPQTAPLLNQALSLSFVISAALCIPGILFSLARGRVHPRRSA
jgi:MFS family permease